MTALALWKPFSSLWGIIAVRLHRKEKPVREVSAPFLPPSLPSGRLFTAHHRRTGRENQIHRLC
jgi:hypothetical protein